MNFLPFKRFEFLVSIGCLALVGYFGWQAQYGARGFTYRDNLAAQVRKLGTDLATTQQQHKILDARVSELRPGSIDPDMLDEMARKSLNYGLPGEVVIHLPN